MQSLASRSLAVAATFLAAASAQRTYVVSAAGGFGVDFTDIPPAVAVAVDGDTLLVRPGLYGGLVMTGKGLYVIGETGVRVANVHVANLAANQRAVVTDVEVVGPLSLFNLPGARNARGPVLFERVTIGTDSPSPSFFDCADVRLSRFESVRSVSISGSEVTITDSTLSVSQFPLGGPPALGVTDSTVMLSRCAVTGPSEFNRAAAGPGISMAGSSVVTVTDDGTHAISAGAAQFATQPSAVVGGGTFIRDPRVRVLAGSAPPVAGPIEIVRPIATLRALGAPVGGNAQIELSGAVGEGYVLVLGLPGPPIPFPQFGGSLGLATLVVVAQGVFGSTPLVLSLLVGPGLPPGFAIGWQAIAGDTRGGWQLSNVATYARTR